MKLIIDARVKERDVQTFLVSPLLTESQSNSRGTRDPRGEVLRIYRQIGDVTARLL